MSDLAFKKPEEFTFSDSDFDKLSQLVTSETGIMLPREKKALMYGRLSRRLRALSMKSFAEYISHLEHDIKQHQQTELSALVNAMTTNVTNFMRETHHFEHLAAMLPELHEKFGEVNIWSSACATGEEPWSIAMIVHQFKLKNPSAKVSITASDLDTVAIEHAQRGIYMVDDSIMEKHALLGKYLKPTKRENLPAFSIGNEYEIKESLPPLVTFKQMNLLKPWPTLSKKFHVVFCRNVIIYFSKETQRGLFAKFEEKMPTGALLYIGHSESLLNVTDAFESLGQTRYRKK